LKTNFPKKAAYITLRANSLIVLCTKSGQPVVNLLHIAVIKADASGSFLLTLKIGGVKTQSFFDAF